LPAVEPDALTVRALVYDSTVVRDCHQRRRRIQTIPPMPRTSTASMTIGCMLYPSCVVRLHPMLEGPRETGTMCRLARSPRMYGRSPPCTDTGKRVNTSHVQEKLLDICTVLRRGNDGFLDGPGKLRDAVGLSLQGNSASAHRNLRGCHLRGMMINNPP
jgi:hypothetical protein